jgi:hypothetical protein
MRGERDAAVADIREAQTLGEALGGEFMSRGAGRLVHA